MAATPESLQRAHGSRPAQAGAGAGARAVAQSPLLLVAAMISAISGLLYGYDTGVISGALLRISDEFQIGSSMKQVIAGSILAGAVIGALTCSRLSGRYGRHRTILLICSVFVIGALACAVAPSALALSAARVVLGFAVGGATQTVPMYVAELAPAERRGRAPAPPPGGGGGGGVVAARAG